MSLNAFTQKNFTSVEIKNTIFKIGDDTSQAKDYIIFKDSKFTDGNPLYCMFHEGNENSCFSFLEE